MKRFLLISAIVLLIAVPVFAQENAKKGDLEISGNFTSVTATNPAPDPDTIDFTLTRFLLDFNVTLGDVGFKLRYLNFGNYYRFFYASIAGFTFNIGDALYFEDYQMTTVTGYIPYATYIGGYNVVSLMGYGYGDFSQDASPANNSSGIMVQYKPNKDLNIGLLLPYDNTAFPSYTFENLEIHAKFELGNVGIFNAGLIFTPSGTDENVYYAGYTLNPGKNLTGKAKFEYRMNQDDALSIGVGYDFGSFGIFGDFTFIMPETGTGTWEAILKPRYAFSKDFEIGAYLVFASTEDFTIEPYLKALLFGALNLETGIIIFDPSVGTGTTRFFLITSMNF